MLVKTITLNLLDDQGSWNMYCIYPFPIRILDLKASDLVLPEKCKTLKFELAFGLVFYTGR